MRFMRSELFKRLRNGAEERQALVVLGAELRAGGFSEVRRFLEDFRTFLRAYEDEGMEQAAGLLSLARQVLPDPGKISPSWKDIWQEFETIISVKNSTLRELEAGAVSRDGEWQVLLDNPYTHQDIVVYPALSFLEAVYLFAYFRHGLAPNEYIRLQKINNIIVYSDRPNRL
ncbi:hypothetical protein ACFO9Q_13185 [Paenibacillus sp. GCM10023252]|uniref:hypothetical protein n=1 Tax=Paenibacillus sp. GCM10023252 TaxID=3252649 RepID=UPI0036237B7E